MGTDQTDTDVKIILASGVKHLREDEVKVLNSLGYGDILEAEDGLQAKKLLQKKRGVCLVISDWNLPNMGGDDLLVWMRTKSKKFKEIPFILASAQSEMSRASEVNEVGAVFFVTKPFVADELRVKIEQALAFRQEHKESINTKPPNPPKNSCKKQDFQKQVGLFSSEEEAVELRDHAPVKKQVSLSQLLFEKGVASPASINSEQRKAPGDDQTGMVEENKNLQAELIELKAILSKYDSKIKNLFKTGVQHLKDEQLFEAAGCFNAVLAFDAKNLKALNNLAVIYFAMDMREQAKKSLEVILEIDPNNQLARENLAQLS